MRDRRLCRWAVSQASPLRRLLVTENLKLYEYRGGGAAGWASGGFLGNSVVKGIVVSGSCHGSRLDPDDVAVIVHIRRQARSSSG